MKLATAALSAAALGLALATGAQADTRNSNDKATMEQKASPAAPKSDEERAEASQGQPGVPHSIGGATVRDTSKDKSKAGKRPSSSTGSSAPGSEADKAQAFKQLDMDGDGAISQAEAAGNAQLMNAFDRADKDRDGKLSRAEYDAKDSKEEAKAKARPKTQARSKTQPEAR
jgi:hypothetical protein